MLNTFRDLLKDYFATSGGRMNTPGRCCLADAFQERLIDLSKQKSELSSQAERAERAALSTETETEARLL